MIEGLELFISTMLRYLGARFYIRLLGQSLLSRLSGAEALPEGGAPVWMKLFPRAGFKM
ncbi:MAG: hypothetical protein IJD04_06035 [Desulfovibrionaceae bacterium]|nr:hypothetical protein [Desulfovibrionaceae bacterium]